jgi:chemotaxis protein CheD
VRDGARIDVTQGDCRVAYRDGDVLTALLGSCVAVCLFDPQARVGGMNHVFQNVRAGPSGANAVVAEIERLVNMLMHAGVARAQLRARVAGGAHLLPRGKRLGDAMAGAALAYLAREGIEVLTADCGGGSARRLSFWPATGALEIAHVHDAFPGMKSPPSGPGNPVELF